MYLISVKPGPVYLNTKLIFLQDLKKGPHKHPPQQLGILIR